MTVRQLIKELADFNPEARVTVVAGNQEHDFSLCFGGADGGTKENADTVDLFVNGLNEQERESGG